MNVQVARYSEQPELWDSISDLSSEVWPEYNMHGDVLNQYWDQLYGTFPEWQFVLFDPGAVQVLAEGHTIPVAWMARTRRSAPASTRPSRPGPPCGRRAGHRRRCARWPPRSRRGTSGAACQPRCCGPWPGWPRRRGWLT
jgi:hypothetical protein